MEGKIASKSSHQILSIKNNTNFSKTTQISKENLTQDYCSEILNTYKNILFIKEKMSIKPNFDHKSSKKFLKSKDKALEKINLDDEIKANGKNKGKKRNSAFGNSRRNYENVFEFEIGVAGSINKNNIKNQIKTKKSRRHSLINNDNVAAISEKIILNKKIKKIKLEPIKKDEDDYSRDSSLYCLLDNFP